MINADTKDKILTFIKENKFKTFMIIASLIVIVFVGLNKKNNKKNDELKEIQTLYTSNENTEEFYKTKYFKAIDPELKSQGKKIEEVVKENTALKEKIENIDQKIVDISKTTYGDILNSNETYAGKNSNGLNDVFKNPNSNGNQPLIPPLKGQGQFETKKVQVIEWEQTQAVS